MSQNMVTYICYKNTAKECADIYFLLQSVEAILYDIYTVFRTRTCDNDVHIVIFNNNVAFLLFRSH